MRLTLEPEPETVTPIHTEQAIQDCSLFNGMENRWATLHVIPMRGGPSVFLEIGNVLSGGFKECKTQTWTYRRLLDKVTVYKHTHEG
jgi:hypothetical protein